GTDLTALQIDPPDGDAVLLALLPQKCNLVVGSVLLLRVPGELTHVLILFLRFQGVAANQVVESVRTVGLILLDEADGLIAPPVPRLRHLHLVDDQPGKEPREPEQRA